MSISDNLTGLRASLPAGVELVAVSKFHPLKALRQAYDAGQRIFGESRALEMTAKAAEMPDDVEWHFIGHLQTNKVRPVVATASLIHSIDSPHLLEAVEKECVRTGRRVRVLMQLHVALEETKFGFTPDELMAYLTPELVGSLKGVTIAGVMGMASNVDDDERIRRDFSAIRSSFDRLQREVFAFSPEFRIVSMGMSHDWPIAVAEGANMVRIGTTIFGEREY
ncbi:MAG: YggS family pyridoxal phosphate-dependent enzyme [Muribaculaceae bacterium]|nr:YggS family pyridoxal phosphate-dependent enzyme [Muribaculaceae bacterium]